MALGVVATEIKHGHQSKAPGSDPGGSLRVKAGWAGLSPQHLRGGSERTRSQRASSAIQLVQGQPGLPETLTQKGKKEEVKEAEEEGEEKGEEGGVKETVDTQFLISCYVRPCCGD